MKYLSRSVSRGLVILLLLLVTIATWISPLDRSASESLEAGMTRAFITFATARGLNAAISVIQGTEVSGGVGVSATFSIGEALDPVNDLIEQFANLMLLATVSFGLQEVLLQIGQHQAVKYVLTLVLVASAGWYLSGRASPRWLRGLLILGLMARFAIPTATLGAEVVFRNFLEENYQANEQAMSRTSSIVRAMTPATEPAQTSAESEDTSWWEDSWEKLKGATQPITLGGKVNALKESVSDTAENVVRLIVVFLLQTLLVPLAILWGCYVVVRNVLGYSGRTIGGHVSKAP